MIGHESCPYMHRDEPDRLVQLAIVHAEFEALHPFLDGNGRMGRMLVPLFMWQRELIHQPAFYVSAYFEANRDAYYEGLRSISRADDWTGWCEFFLDAVRTQAEDNLVKTEASPGTFDDHITVNMIAKLSCRSRMITKTGTNR